jgi:UDP-N-acetylglucosamine--N-acetylmuramyl-(pentapeptide) pyrophosphoryl-undecaprenol N-acetylglucosamine transferase
VHTTAGASLLLPQSELAPDRLGKEISRLLIDSDRLQAMAASARLQARPDAAEWLADQLLELAGWSASPVTARS